jgi:hypothetical protein
MAFAAAAAETGRRPVELIHDSDRNFQGAFGAPLEDIGFKAAPIRYHAPP